ncbi:MAG: hypothetical protein H0T89_22550 [Deltaproteobacteria bacterium]|nr:hypothetical protein [Deltaproteobacteria bacterium]
MSFQRTSDRAPGREAHVIGGVAACRMATPVATAIVCVTPQAWFAGRLRDVVIATHANSREHCANRAR